MQHLQVILFRNHLMYYTSIKMKKRKSVLFAGASQLPLISFYIINLKNIMFNKQSMMYGFVFGCL